MIAIKTFFATLKKNEMRFWGFLLFYIVLASAVAVSAVFMERVTGDMSQAALDFDVNTLLQFLLVLTGIMAVRAISSSLSALFLGRFAGNAGHKFRENFGKYFLHMPFAKFEAAGSGESLSIYSNDVPAAVRFVSEGGMRMIGDILSLIASFVFMLTVNVFFTLIFFATFPVLVVLQVVISGPLQKRSKVMSEETANFNAVVNDSLQNVSTIAAYSLEEVLEKRYISVYENFMTAAKRFAQAMLPLVMVGILASLTPIVLVNILAAFSVIDGNMNIAQFIAFTGVATVAGQWLMMLSQVLAQVQEMAAGAKRFNENTADAPEVLNGGEKIDTTSSVGISFDNVSFRYTEDGPLALDKVSFNIAPGSRVAFVGGSGSGKSTVLKLLLGLYEAEEGNIEISGKNISTISKKSLRDAFAYVPQDSFLFPESIGENISLEKNTSDKKRLENACSDAGILEFINSLPNKFDSVLSESAENISGGQRQRIAMARAFYKNAPVIMFDEATSALDPATEASILDSFESVSKGKTVVMVAHRVRAIAACDTVIVMDAGKISAIGSHEELLIKSEIYKNLYENQSNEEKMGVA